MQSSTPGYPLWSSSIVARLVGLRRSLVRPFADPPPPAVGKVQVPSKPITTVATTGMVAADHFSRARFGDEPEPDCWVQKAANHSLAFSEVRHDPEDGLVSLANAVVQYATIKRSSAPPVSDHVKQRSRHRRRILGRHQQHRQINCPQGRSINQGSISQKNLEFSEAKSLSIIQLENNPVSGYHPSCFSTRIASWPWQKLMHHCHPRLLLASRARLRYDSFNKGNPSRSSAMLSGSKNQARPVVFLAFANEQEGKRLPA